jgi:hypothetical protein
MILATFDPVYPDTHGSGGDAYKGQLQCGVYKVLSGHPLNALFDANAWDSLQMSFLSRMVGRNQSCPHIINKDNEMSECSFWK